MIRRFRPTLCQPRFERVGDAIDSHEGRVREQTEHFAGSAVIDVAIVCRRLGPERCDQFSATNRRDVRDPRGSARQCSRRRPPRKIHGGADRERNRNRDQCREFPDLSGHRRPNWPVYWPPDKTVNLRAFVEGKPYPDAGSVPPGPTNWLSSYSASAGNGFNPIRATAARQPLCAKEFLFGPSLIPISPDLRTGRALACRVPQLAQPPAKTSREPGHDRTITRVRPPDLWSRADSLTRCLPDNRSGRFASRTPLEGSRSATCRGGGRCHEHHRLGH